MRRLRQVPLIHGTFEEMLWTVANSQNMAPREAGFGAGSTRQRQRQRGTRRVVWLRRQCTTRLTPRERLRCHTLHTSLPTDPSPESVENFERQLIHAAMHLVAGWFQSNRYVIETLSV